MGVWLGKQTKMTKHQVKGSNRKPGLRRRNKGFCNQKLETSTVTGDSNMIGPMAFGKGCSCCQISAQQTNNETTIPQTRHLPVLRSPGCTPPLGKTKLKPEIDVPRHSSWWKKINERSE